MIVNLRSNRFSMTQLKSPFDKLKYIYWTFKLLWLNIQEQFDWIKELPDCQIAAEDDGLESKDSRLKKEGEKLNAEIERNGHVLANLRPDQPLQVLLVFFGGFLLTFGHVDLAKIVPSFVGLKKKVQNLY